MNHDTDALIAILQMLRADYHNSAQWRQAEINIAVKRIEGILGYEHSGDCEDRERLPNVSGGI